MEELCVKTLIFFFFLICGAQLSIHLQFISIPVLWTDHHLEQNFKTPDHWPLSYSVYSTSFHSRDIFTHFAVAEENWTTLLLHCDPLLVKTNLLHFKNPIFSFSKLMQTGTRLGLSQLLLFGPQIQLWFITIKIVLLMRKWLSDAAALCLKLQGAARMSTYSKKEA